MARHLLWTAAIYVIATAAPAHAQTSTSYYLRPEDSATWPLLQLNTIGAGSTTVAVQTGDLKNQPPGSAVMRSYYTEPGVPNLVGTIPSGTTISVTLWMKKTASFGVVYPQASVGLNWANPVPLCQATGQANRTPPQEITTNLQPITISCLTSAAISMTETDRVYVNAGYQMTTGPANKSMKVELDFGGSSASVAVVPNPIPPTPVITSLNPSSAPLNWPITISGSNFGQSAGSVKFYNNVTATIDSWSNTSIQTHVPANAATGPVTVTSPSNVTSAGSSFTLLGPPTLTSLSPSSAHLNESVTITGTNFMSTQSTSTVTSITGSRPLRRAGARRVFRSPFRQERQVAMWS